ncbi:retrotransposon protein, putative, ty1-copia subclass, partial [Tanacetum coccineum]
KAKKSVRLMMKKLFRMELELIPLLRFWSTVVAKTINGEVQLHALVDGKKIIITESTVRRDLQLEDAEGVDCLPNSTIFEQPALMGMVRNLDNLSEKFLMYPRRVGKGFSGRVTPLFQIMVVQNQSELGEGSANPTDPHHTPTIIQSSTQPQKTQKPRKPKRKDTQDASKQERIDAIDADEEITLDIYSKKKIQIMLDEETALNLQAEFDEEERLAREKAEKEERDNIALIKNDSEIKVDYEETFSLIAYIRAIRILIAIAAFYDYEIWQMDVKTAFLNRHLSEEVYMVQPEGVKAYLGKCFAIKDLGEAAYILKIKIYGDRSRRLIGLCQSAYIEKILKRFYMDNSKRRSIPKQEKLKLSKTQGASTPAEVKRVSWLLDVYDASKEAVWVRKFISELGVVPTINNGDHWRLSRINPVSCLPIPTRVNPKDAFNLKDLLEEYISLKKYKANCENEKLQRQRQRLLLPYPSPQFHLPNPCYLVYSLITPMLYNFTSLPNVNSSTPIPTTIEQVDNVEDAALLAFKRPRGPTLVMKAESSSSQMVSPTPSGFAIKKEETERKFILLADPSWNS